MGIKGFQGTSLLDFPGRIASLVFFGGCNLTCPYCHNPSLVLDPEQYPDYPVAALLDDLRERRNFIDGVVISGGEPTLDTALFPLLREIKGLGLQVKLDTNGLLPEVLEGLLDLKLLDYVALDLKTSPERYGELHSGPVHVQGLVRSAELLRESGIRYELRTTCVPGLIEEADIRSIGELARGAERWYLQQYHPGHALDEELRALEPHPVETIRAFAALAGEYVGEVGIRGI
jgi:pyruvate formate lyase activating enzyme